MKIKKGIIYANFVPYDNAGNILDYLVDNFLFVAHFSFRFHKIGIKNQYNTLTIYKGGKLIRKIAFLNLNLPESFIYIFIPITSILFLLQLTFYIVLLRLRGQRFDYFFSANAVLAWMGNLLRLLGVVKETIYWVWDYYPLRKNPIIIKTIRSLYWYLDSNSAKYSTHTFFLHKNLKQLREKINKVKYPNSSIIPIGTNVRNIRITKKVVPIIGYLGVVKKTQGVDILFDALPKLLKEFPNLKVEIIGSGPEEERLKKIAGKFPKTVKFYGFIESLSEVLDTMQNWSVGLATYLHTPDNPAYFTDPSKIKAYLSVGVPVISTTVTTFSKELNETDAGIVTNYTKKEFIEAVRKLLRHQQIFSNNALRLAKRYDYRKIYKFFET